MPLFRQGTDQDSEAVFPVCRGGGKVLHLLGQEFAQGPAKRPRGPDAVEIGKVCGTGHPLQIGATDLGPAGVEPSVLHVFDPANSQFDSLGLEAVDSKPTPGVVCGFLHHFSEFLRADASGRGVFGDIGILPGGDGLR